MFIQKEENLSKKLVAISPLLPLSGEDKENKGKNGVVDQKLLLEVQSLLDTMRESGLKANDDSPETLLRESAKGTQVENKANAFLAEIDPDKKMAIGLDLLTNDMPKMLLEATEGVNDEDLNKILANMTLNLGKVQADMTRYHYDVATAYQEIARIVKDAMVKAAGDMKKAFADMYKKMHSWVARHLPGLMKALSIIAAVVMVAFSMGNPAMMMLSATLLVVTSVPHGTEKMTEGVGKGINGVCGGKLPESVQKILATIIIVVVIAAATAGAGVAGEGLQAVKAGESFSEGAAAAFKGSEEAVVSEVKGLVGMLKNLSAQIKNMSVAGKGALAGALGATATFQPVKTIMSSFIHDQNVLMGIGIVESIAAGASSAGVGAVGNNVFNLSLRLTRALPWVMAATMAGQATGSSIQAHLLRGQADILKELGEIGHGMSIVNSQFQVNDLDIRQTNQEMLSKMKEFSSQMDKTAEFNVQAASETRMLRM